MLWQIHLICFHMQLPIFADADYNFMNWFQLALWLWHLGKWDARTIYYLDSATPAFWCLSCKLPVASTFKDRVLVSIDGSNWPAHQGVYEDFNISYDYMEHVESSQIIYSLKHRGGSEACRHYIAFAAIEKWKSKATQGQLDTSLEFFLYVSRTTRVLKSHDIEIELCFLLMVCPLFAHAGLIPLNV